jgi:hypothetical protein
MLVMNIIAAPVTSTVSHEKRHERRITLMRKWFRSTGSLIVACLIWLAPAAAQQAPIELTIQEAGGAPDARRVIVAQLRNVSSKVVAAYVIRLDYRDDDGKLTFRQASTSLTWDLGLSKGREGYQPGEQWLDRLRVATDEKPSEVTLDLVVYADGTHWGEDRTGKLNYLRGINAGAGLERFQ